MQRKKLHSIFSFCQASGRVEAAWRIGRWMMVIVLPVVMSGCRWLEPKRQSGVVAELKGEQIYEIDIVRATAGLHGEDSARVAEAYLRKWACEILEENEGKRIADSKEVERLVADYRHSLYKYAYEQRLIQQRMPKEVSDSLVQAFYTLHSEEFILKESIVKGLIVTVPNDAPDIKKLRKAMQDLDADNIEFIEKYAYQYASGYELFPDEWKTANEILMVLPFEKNDLLQQLKVRNQIELQDSLSTYILQVTDKHLQGERQPMDYAREEIEELLLARRQVSFLDEARKELYNDAVKYKKIKLYE